MPQIFQGCLLYVEAKVASNTSEVKKNSVNEYENRLKNIEAAHNNQ